ncbi:DUF4142 domain-containing protein [Humisphaera borealis]|uniref:DUF4142 domain-containing protein n=1 Tax=Humisphaera borealis TaxID=2807512 RepID=A0A7M2X157_9BACT|nr:DUF4142 domain-containing protein [Humisphaera borealis]QOV91433.1 DUF4142 domain-containing protein [Humisphaera borealis]
MTRMKTYILKAAIVSALVTTPLLAQNQPAARDAQPTPRPQAQPLQPAGENPQQNGPTGERSPTPADRAAEDRGADRNASSRMDPKVMSQEFVRHASSANQFEIELGQLAQERAQRAEVKAFARDLVAAHQKAQQSLEQAAKTSNLDVSKELTPVHQAKLTMFRAKRGAEFDKAYTYGMVGGHSEAALWYRDGANELQDPAVKQYAAATLPAIREHLQTAKQLAGDDSAAMPASSVQKGQSRQEGKTPGRRDGDAVVPSRTDGTPTESPKKD